MKIEFKFEGHLSGDLESFCWDIDAKTAERFEKELGIYKKEKSCFHKDMFRIYPNDLFGYDKEKYRFTVCIEKLYV